MKAKVGSSCSMHVLYENDLSLLLGSRVVAFPKSLREIAIALFIHAAD